METIEVAYMTVASLVLNMLKPWLTWHLIWGRLPAKWEHPIRGEYPGVYVFMCVCMCVCLHVWVCVFTFEFVCVCLCLHVFVFAFVCVCVFGSVYMKFTWNYLSPPMWKAHSWKCICLTRLDKPVSEIHVFVHFTYDLSFNGCSLITQISAHWNTK